MLQPKFGFTIPAFLLLQALRKLVLYQIDFKPACSRQFYLRILALNSKSFEAQL